MRAFLWPDDADAAVTAAAAILVDDNHFRVGLLGLPGAAGFALDVNPDLVLIAPDLAAGRRRDRVQIQLSGRCRARAAAVLLVDNDDGDVVAVPEQSGFGRRHLQFGGAGGGGKSSADPDHRADDKRQCHAGRELAGHGAAGCATGRMRGKLGDHGVVLLVAAGNTLF